MSNIYYLSNLFFILVITKLNVICKHWAYDNFNFLFSSNLINEIIVLNIFYINRYK